MPAPAQPEVRVPTPDQPQTVPAVPQATSRTAPDPSALGSGPIVVFEDSHTSTQVPATADLRVVPQRDARSPAPLSEQDVARITGSSEVGRMSQTTEGQEMMRELFGDDGAN
jgi:hypothetical protein